MIAIADEPTSDRVCSVCGIQFTPRTVNQVCCTLECFVKTRRKKGRRRGAALRGPRSEQRGRPRASAGLGSNTGTDSVSTLVVRTYFGDFASGGFTRRSHVKS